eukprot:CAMPEP_0179110994 /NCGR_PEP_ID=MMETSP0796-20121207/51825_1 /TAXON_ID=73915 /ORGANISM="Pyrodinium bahamense, Strain pbaha01" /LENGTH=67 /DNA_ID=CAMNT_0020809139 /DNA_START=356 /DNA_END=559 /DNA_ORIENTATION=+
MSTVSTPALDVVPAMMPASSSAAVTRALGEAKVNCSRKFCRLLFLPAPACTGPRSTSQSSFGASDTS